MVYDYFRTTTVHVQYAVCTLSASVCHPDVERSRRGPYTVRVLEPPQPLLGLSLLQVCTTISPLPRSRESGDERLELGTALEHVDGIRGVPGQLRALLQLTHVLCARRGAAQALTQLEAVVLS